MPPTPTHGSEERRLAVRAEAMIDANAYMTIASADAEGRPWASPVWFAHDRYATYLWVSRPGARHSQNLLARPEVGIVIFDSTVAEDAADAVYIDGIGREATAPELDGLMAVFSARSVQRGGVPWTVADVTGDAPHRLYLVRAVAQFVLGEGDRRVRVTIG